MGRARSRGTRAGGGGAGADDAHGQAHQCGFPDRGFNAAGQYHGARAAAAVRPRTCGYSDRAAIIASALHDSHGAGDTSGGNDGHGADGGKEARSEIRARRGAGSACAGARSTLRCRSRGRQRLTLSKTAGGR